ncbi:hypothetical protein ACIBQ1_48870 [Nonomuraea sp. NPDC050153]|uniref:SbtR family transcriptional regulator n=1 Tax=Nonomuraea sp. NPDC050153 TaxID=3364359 RepID=UPI0037A5A68A
MLNRIFYNRRPLQSKLARKRSAEETPIRQLTTGAPSGGYGFQRIDQIVGRPSGRLALPGQAVVAPAPRDQWISALVAHIRRVRGLAEEIARAVTEPDSALGKHCTAAITAAGELVARVEQTGRLRAPVTRDTVIALATAVAWAGDQRSCERPDSEDLIDILLYGLVTRDVTPE